MYDLKTHCINNIFKLISFAQVNSFKYCYVIVKN